MNKEKLEKLAQLLEDIVRLLRENPGDQAPTPAPAPVQPVTADPATIPTGVEEAAALEQVRAKLAALARAGKAAQIRELIQSYGADNLTSVPVGKLGELLTRAEGL